MFILSGQYSWVPKCRLVFGQCFDFHSVISFPLTKVPGDFAGAAALREMLL